MNEKTNRAVGKSYEDGAYKGDPLDEALKRMRRLETRIMNLCRSMGLVPGMQPPNPTAPAAIWHRGRVIATVPTVTMADIMACAALNSNEVKGDVEVVVGGQIVGTVRLPEPGDDPAPGVHDGRPA